MTRSPRFWLGLAGGWLLAAGLAHTAAHLWLFVLEHDMVGLREFAMNAMKQAQSADPLRPSLWRQFRMFSVSHALLLLFAGTANLVVARLEVPARARATFALFGTVFWTIAFLPYAFVDPVIQPLVVTAVAVPLHGIACLTATLGDEAAPTTTTGTEGGSHRTSGEDGAHHEG